MGTLGTICSPHPSQKAQMQYFFPCEDTGGGLAGRRRRSSTENLKNTKETSKLLT